MGQKITQLPKSSTQATRIRIKNAMGNTLQNYRLSELRMKGRRTASKMNDEDLCILLHKVFKSHDQIFYITYMQAKTPVILF